MADLPKDVSFLFLFLDGVGLGQDAPATNPFAAARMPTLGALLGGQRLLAEAAPFESPRVTLLAVDATLGVAGRPQSASGQATLLTGKNVPVMIGEHYGPKPNPAIARILQNGNLFHALGQRGFRTALLNAYPPRYFQAIESGRRIYSAIPMAATSAGVALKTVDDLNSGLALSADFTGQGWQEQLGFSDAPLYAPFGAGRKMASLAQEYDFAFFDYWVSDYLGHRQDREIALEVLEDFDQVLGGLLEGWPEDNGLILITSDHGNLEDLSVRHHTVNRVPLLVIGPEASRRKFVRGLENLAMVAPAVQGYFSNRS